MAVFTSQSIINKLFLFIFLFPQMDRYVLFCDCTFMKHYDIFLDFFFCLTHKAFLMPRACPGASMYYTLRHVVPTSAFDIFLCSIICTSTAIIFIFWKFFHIHYFETLFSIFNMVSVILFANLLTSKSKNIRIWNIRIFSAVNHTQSCMAIIFSTSLLICTSCGI